MSMQWTIEEEAEGVWIVRRGSERHTCQSAEGAANLYAALIRAGA